MRTIFSVRPFQRSSPIVLYCFDDVVDIVQELNVTCFKIFHFKLDFT